MKCGLVLKSSDFEALKRDDLILTFYDAESESKIEVVLDEHIAKKLAAEIDCYK